MKKLFSGSVMAGKAGIQRGYDQSPEELREIAKRLRAVASALNGVALAMEKQDVAVVRVEGRAMVERAFNSLSKFVGYCQRGIQEF